ncbi:MAG: aldehyde dehydrogenase family protein, partial [Oscillospiraceae bacterium]|nr:aldehyde dehydrogenase family protein [Oscillospiraceae bacterium]
MSDLNTILDSQRAFFASGQTRPAAFRKAQLTKLGDWIKTHDEELLAALREDLGKARFEGYATEVGIVLDEIKYVR